MTAVPRSTVRRRLLVTTSTYPRWADDPEPGFVHELARRLATRFDVTVLAPHARGAKVFERLDGVDVVRFRYAPARWERLVHGGGIGTNLRRMPVLWLLVPVFALAHAVALVRCLRRIRPDVLHAHWIIPQAACLRAVQCLGVPLPPVVLTSHGADLFSFRGALAVRIKRWALRCADAVTVVSEGMRAPMRELGVDDTRMGVEPMGVDLEKRFTPPESRPASDDLLFVGRFVEKKGLALLIEAMPHVLAARPAARLRIAGFGPEDASYRALASRLGIAARCEFLGPVAQRDLATLYREAALLVAPFVEAGTGDQEGLGLVVLEACGCGCPVLAGRVRATDDLLALTDRGVATVDPRDPRALADAIVARLADPAAAQADARRAHDALARRMGWTQVADRYAARLSSLAAARR